MSFPDIAQYFCLISYVTAFLSIRYTAKTVSTNILYFTVSKKPQRKEAERDQLKKKYH